MKKFEYKAIIVNQSGNALKPIMEEGALNKMGDEGWELVGTEKCIVKTGLLLIFKRDILNEDGETKKSKKGSSLF